jgi:hypothetical protein
MAVDTLLGPLNAVPTATELLDEFPGFELPTLSVGTLFRADDSVAVSGSVDPDVATTAELTINGHRVPISEWGAFCAVVRLHGQSALKLCLKTEEDRAVTLDVSLKAR